MTDAPLKGPKFCVWEVTLACNARCVHCGSKAGVARECELDTHEALALVRELAQAGCFSVTLSGGEPLLRSDWPELGAAIRESGMRLEMITNGLAVTAQADAIAVAGFFAVTMSVDGPAAIHDQLRGVPGGLDRLLQGAAGLKERGVRLGACTQVNRMNLGAMDEIHALLREHGFEGWQIQLTMPLGLASSGPDGVCLEPKQLLELEPKILEYQRDPAFFCQASDNVGYMSRHEPRLRSGTGRGHQFFGGCRAGLDVVGITSDGRVRGCLSLPREFDEGGVRERPFGEIWSDPGAFAWNRDRRPKALAGSCAACPFGKVCRAGCTCLAYTSTGSMDENPYCLFALGRRSKGAR
ncbi:MAG: radical SAM protein [Deltaproteobacteria bacterium]|nr:radical SAM protein [Deltaproteobacteria bacterium]